MDNDIKQPDSNPGDKGDDSLESQDSAPQVTEVPATKPEETVEAEKTPEPETKQSSGGSKTAIWVVLVVLALIIGSGVGYAIGMNKEKSPTAEQQALASQVVDLQNQLDEAEKAASDSASSDKDKQIADLQAENADLKAQIADLQEQIDELEDAQTTPPTDTTE